MKCAAIGAACGTRARTRIRVAGFTLIELMIAIALALFLVLVLAGVMVAVGSSSRVQTGTTRLQENARYALRRIGEDIRQAASSYCLNFAAADGAVAPGAAAHVDTLRALRVAFDAADAPLMLGAPNPAAGYFVDPGEFVLGSECAVGGGCAPDPDSFRALRGAPLPALGSQVGQRAQGADVLSLRFLRGAGMPIASVTSAAADGINATIVLAPGVSLDGLSPAVLATDCTASVAVRVAKAGGQALALQGNFDNDAMPELSTANAKLFDLQRDLATVTYYLRIDNDPNAAAPRRISSLVRRVNGNDEVIANGIERLDFLYHIEQSDGRTLVLDASQLDAHADCRGLAVPEGALVNPAACGWRSLKGVEVFLLANTVEDVIPAGGDTSPHAFRYAWRVDGTVNDDASYESPTDIASLPSGLPPGRMLRREFRTFVAMRGMNP